MKKKFKYVMMMASALLIGFSSCSNDDETGGGVDNTPKDIRVTVKAPSTYAEEETAVGVTPEVNDLTVFFHDGISIKEVGTMAKTDMAVGKTFNGVPGSATTVVIIGNATALSSPATMPAVNDPVSNLDKLMFQQSVQTDPESDVNLYGSAGITGTNVAVTITPAIARIEIDQVSADASASIPLTSFDLLGVYINNTYTELGTDYMTVPTATSSILNYGQTASVWTTAGTYPPRFCDEYTTEYQNGTSYNPTTTGADAWSYYVMPVKAFKADGVTPNGTIIDGKQQSAVPQITLKIGNAAAAGYTLPSVAYVNISQIEVSGTPIKELERGKVFHIADIAIGGEHLSSKPAIPATQDISVTATLTPWTNQPVTPVLP